MVTATKTETKLLTADDLLRLYSKGIKGELIRGVLNEKVSAGVEHGEIVVNWAILLGGFVKPRKLGRLMGSDSGVRLEQDPDTVREPDLAFFAADSLPPGVRVRGYAEVVPDLVVEVKSPTDSFREVRDKARMWLDFGVRLVWVGYPGSRSIEVYRADGSVETLNIGDALNGEDVLPGFSCPVREVFDF